MNQLQPSTREIAAALMADIDSAFAELDNQDSSDNRVWSSILFRHLHDLGSGKFGCDVRYTYTDAHRGTQTNWEFLCDLLWLKTECPDLSDHGWFRTGHLIRRCVLACEIEWDFRAEHVLYDFAKLLIIRSDMSLMVVQAINGAARTDLIGRLKEAAEALEERREIGSILIATHVHDAGTPRVAYDLL